MKISNVEIAKIIAEKGYDFQRALDGIDAGRTPDDEKMEITKEELDELVDNVCFSFIQEEEMDMIN